MDTLFFHPKVVHIPIALGVLMPVISGALLLAWWRKWLPPRGWLVAIALQAILLVSGMVAMKSGEAEEASVERVVAERYIEAHEQAAEAFVWGSAGVLVLMIAAGALASRRSGLPAAVVATCGTLVVLGLGYRTGEAGGNLVYTHGAAQAHVGAKAAPAPIARHHEKGDD